ncbi:hypothetical protein [Methylocystis sp.]
MPTSSIAGVMSIAGKAAASLSAPLDRVNWLSHPQRHHSWRHGCAHFSCGMHIGVNPANAPDYYAFATPYRARWSRSYLRALSLYKDDVNAREAADGLLSD